MLRFFASLYRLLRFGSPHENCHHQWVEDGFRRHCPKCDTHQMLMENRYPEVGEPKYEWR